MPRAVDTRVDNYLAVLEMAMLDGFLAEHEKDQLIETAVAVGLTRGQVLDVHGDYLQAMAEVALADHVVTSAERAELNSVASMLGLRPGDVDRALGDAQSRAVKETTAVDTLATAVIDLEPGDRVVFTGDLKLERAQWEARARSAGLEPGGVTKKTKVVIAADPNSHSAKAAKARQYGVPIITEGAFARLLARATQRPL